MATLEVAGERSPTFEMHSYYPGWSGTLEPGGSGTLRVLFDPGVHDHGPQDRVVQGVVIISDDPRVLQHLVRVAARVRK